MSALSGKLLLLMGKMKKKTLSKALREEMNVCRKSLEGHRVKVMKMSNDDKAQIADLKRGIQEADKDAKTADELIKMAKPFCGN